MRDVVGADKTCMEKDCTFSFQGKTFESGGSFIGLNPKTGKHGGIVYAYEKDGQVGNWHGDVKVRATFGKEWRSKLVTPQATYRSVRQSVYFTWNGINFYGVYCKSNGDIIRVREIKK